MNLKRNIELLLGAKAVFFDFDGVIKDSIDIKSDAFGELFKQFGPEFVHKVKNHHEENGGVSRFDKIPIYMQWAGINITDMNLKKYLEYFSLLTIEKVVKSNWVPGIIKYLKQNNNKQSFFILTATPQEDINLIITELEIKEFFVAIVGSPTNKYDAMRKLLDNNSILAGDAVMIGDSYEDYKAAQLNSVSFLLKMNAQNKALQKKLNCPMIRNFNDG